MAVSGLKNQGGQLRVPVILRSSVMLLASKMESFDFGLRESLTLQCLGEETECGDGVVFCKASF